MSSRTPSSPQAIPRSSPGGPELQHPSRSPLEYPDRPLTGMELVDDLYFVDPPGSEEDPYFDRQTSAKRRPRKPRRPRGSVRNVGRSVAGRQTTVGGVHQPKPSSADPVAPQLGQSPVTEQKSRSKKRSAELIPPGQPATKKATRTTRKTAQNRGQQREVPAVIVPPTPAAPYQSSNTRPASGSSLSSKAEPTPGAKLRDENANASRLPQRASSPRVPSPETEAAALTLMSIKHGRTSLPGPRSQRSTSTSSQARMSLSPTRVVSPLASSAKSPSQRPDKAGPKMGRARRRKTVQVGNKTVDRTTANEGDLSKRIQNEGYVLDPGCRSCKALKQACKVLPGVSSRCAYCCLRKGNCGHADLKRLHEEARAVAASEKRRGGKGAVPQNRDLIDAEPNLELKQAQEQQPDQLVKPSPQDELVNTLDKAPEETEPHAAVGVDSAGLASPQRSPELVGVEQAHQTRESSAGLQRSPVALGIADSRRKPSTDSTMSEGASLANGMSSSLRQESKTPDLARSQAVEGSCAVLKLGSESSTAGAH